MSREPGLPQDAAAAVHELKGSTVGLSIEVPPGPETDEIDAVVCAKVYFVPVVGVAIAIGHTARVGVWGAPVDQAVDATGCRVTSMRGVE